MILKTTLIPKGYQAMCLWPFILVLPEFSSDKGLIEHEMVHYKEQAWATPVWWARYLLSKSFRQAAEVRAYKKQIEVGGITKEWAAAMLCTYGLNITATEAFDLL